MNNFNNLERFKLKILRNSEILEPQWEHLLHNSPYASPFQTPAYYNIINNIPGFAAHVLSVLENGTIVALCVVTIQKEKGIRGYFSKRSIIYGGPVVDENANEALAFLIQTLISDFRKKTIYTEIRNYYDYSHFESIYKTFGWKWLPYLDIKITIKDRTLNEILLLMKYNRRREIKLTLNEGVQYKETTDDSEIEKLYSILNKLYKQKVKLPLPNIQFFKSLYKSIFGKIFIVIHNDEIIGGSFCIFTENREIYTMYYCGLRNYKRNIFPTHISVLAAIDFGIKNRMECVKMMGAGRTDKEYGVRNYKQEFGGELNELGRYLKINKVLLYNLGKLGIRFMKILSK